MGIGVLINIFYLRKLLIIWSIVVTTVVATIIGIVLPKQFESTAIVQVDSIQRNTLTGLVEPRVRVAEFLGQQAAIAGSRTVALDVIDMLANEGYFAMSDFEEDYRQASGRNIVAGDDAKLWGADQLLKSIKIQADSLESTLAISFRNEDPSQAARVSNAFSDAYMQAVLDKRQRRALRNAASFGEEQNTLGSALEVAQGQLTNFREDSGIIAFGAHRLEAAEVELASLTARLAEARADRAEAVSLLNQVRAGGRDVLLTVPLPGEILYARQAQARLGATLSQMARIAERYGPQYPDYVEAQNEKRVLEDNILKAIANRAEYHERRASMLAQDSEKLKQAVVKLQDKKQAFDQLEKKVEARQETYDMIATRSLEESLQSRVDNVTTFLLARAVPSLNPVTPPLPVISLIGIVLGCILGAFAAFALELKEARIRSAKAVGQILNTPVLIEISKVRSESKSTKVKSNSTVLKRRAA